MPAGWARALMAIVAQGDRQSGRIYSPCAVSMEEVGTQRGRRTWKPETPTPREPARLATTQGRRYGMNTRSETYFTDRQLVALTTFSDLVGEARDRIRADAVAAGLPDNGVPPPRRRHRRDGLRGGGQRVLGVCAESCGRPWLDDLFVGQQSEDGSSPQHIRSPSDPNDVGLRGGESILNFNG